jgi:hypothetical protein
VCAFVCFYPSHVNAGEAFGWTLLGIFALQCARPAILSPASAKDLKRYQKTLLAPRSTAEMEQSSPDVAASVDKVSAAVVETSIVCELCTFINKAGSRSCEICSHSFPIARIDSRSIEESAAILCAASVSDIVLKTPNASTHISSLETVGELLAWFFEFYSSEFQPGYHVVDINAGALANNKAVVLKTLDVSHGKAADLVIDN